MNQKQNKLKASRRNETIMINREINEAENKKKIEKKMKTES